MVNIAENRRNIFPYIPKSISSEAFFVWLMNYLDSDKEYEKYKQSFFDKLLLKKEDIGKPVSEIVVNSQERNLESVLSFHFKEAAEMYDILLLFGNQISNMVSQEQLNRYKRLYPKCYRYIYYKVGYITTTEELCINHNQFELITDGMMESVLETMNELHPLIEMYTDYLQNEGDAVNTYYERIFLKHDKEVLKQPAAQKYLLDTFLENSGEDLWNI